jgi:hypothetical protein
MAIMAMAAAAASHDRHGVEFRHVRRLHHRSKPQRSTQLGGVVTRPRGSHFGSAYQRTPCLASRRVVPTSDNLRIPDTNPNADTHPDPLAYPEREAESTRAYRRPSGAEADRDCG